MANTEALRELRRVAGAVPEDRLHMRTWCEEAECGTAYCLAGWARLDPWFIEQTTIATLFSVDAAKYVRARETAGSGDTCRGLARLLDIPVNQAEALFGAGLANDIDPHAVTKGEILERIDALIDGEDIEPYDACDRDDDDFGDEWPPEDDDEDDD